MNTGNSARRCGISGFAKYFSALVGNQNGRCFEYYPTTKLSILKDANYCQFFLTDPLRGTDKLSQNKL